MKSVLKKSCATFLAVLMLLSVFGISAQRSAAVSAEEFVLPESVDNSTSPYFPEIGNQGSMGSCTSWAHVYYSFTYAMNKARGIITTPENTYSPQWSYNLTSNGEGEGSTSADIEYFLEKQGAVYLSMVPYESDPVTWCSDEDVWRESINNRLADTIKYTSFGYEKSCIISPDDTDLVPVKIALAQGEILTFSTSINSWVTTKLTEHKDAPENSKFLGEETVKYQDGAKGGHAMTIVGYNDNIWTDINSNGEVDSGELGAFKIANSWGDGYCNDGFIWIAYDAVNKKSSVNGFEGPNNRQMIMSGVEGVVVRPYGQGTDVYIKYNYTTDNRRGNYIIITAEKDGTSYTYKAFFPLLTLASGEAKIPYDGNMLISLDNVIPDISAENFSDYTWSVTFTDKKKDDCKTTYRNAEIVIESTGQTFKPSGTYPITLNGEEKTVEFAETKLNHAVVYYRGYSSPLISYTVDGENWADSLFMEPNTERQGYVNKYVIDLGDKDSATLYFSDSQGNKDTNSGKFYSVKKGNNFFVTEGVAEPLDVKLTLGNETVEKTMSNEFVTEVSGGYAPYTYQYTFKNLDTGETDESNESSEYQTYIKSFNKTGNYSLTVKVTDYSGKVACKTLNFQVIDSSFEFAEFDVTNEGEIFIGDEISFRAITRYEDIQRFGIAHEQYDFVVKKDGEICYEAVLDPDSYNYGKMTSTVFPTWTPSEKGHYTATISGTDFGKEYAEISVEFDVVNKAYVYYRGYYSPLINYRTDDALWVSKPMENSLDVYGYVNLFVIDLGDSKSTQVYFSDSQGNKDTNNSAYYEVKTGKNYIVTEEAALPLEAKIILDKTVSVPEEGFVFTADITGGYAPYSYMYICENIATGEKSFSQYFDEIADFEKVFSAEGAYRVTLCVTDYAGTEAAANVDVNVITPTEATTASTAVVTEPTTETIPESTAESTVDETQPDETSVATTPTQIIEEFVGIIGDTNGDGKINIKDATLIQKYIANIDIGAELKSELADCTEDGKVSVKDVTLIQKYLAKFEAGRVGEEYKNVTVVTLPAATEETSMTHAQTQTSTPDEPAKVPAITTEPETENVSETSEITEPAEITTAEATEATTVMTVPTEETTAEPTEAPTYAPTEVPTEVPTEPAPEPVSNTVTFTNSFGWSGVVSCYYWSDEDVSMTSWPGVPMENAGTNGFGETMYTLEVPQKATYIIFTNGASQTVDIAYSGGEVRFYPTSKNNEKGYFFVETW